MAQALVAAFVVLSAAAQAQTSSSSPNAGAGNPTQAQGQAQSQEEERIRREVDAKVEEAKKQLKDELRAQMATQAATDGFNEEWTQEKRKLDLFVPDGYFRVRPDLFNKFDLGRLPDPDGYSLFPHQGLERTMTGINMRFRFEPTLNISEEVRIHAQMDALDNIVWGSTPDYAWAMSDRVNLGLLSGGQVAPAAGINSVYDSVRVKRVWGEVATPVGILRFGRMGSQWGLGMYHNDGNCIDCDYGETVDRAQFVIEPLSGYYIIPMFDMNASGYTGSIYQNEGPQYNLAQADDTYSFVLVLARRDTDAQAKARLENNLSVFNYGVHFTYRTEKYEGPQQGQPFTFNNPQLESAYMPDVAAQSRVFRGGTVYMPDLWVKYEQKRLRLELEGMGIFGSTNVANYLAPGAPVGTIPNPLSVGITQWGFAAQTEYKFFDGALRVGLDFGAASGGHFPGFGNHPARPPLPGNTRPGTAPYVGTVPGDIDGPQYCVPGPGVCYSPDNTIRNFQFSRDYHIDMILWREILGGVTDAFYLRPNARYTITEGLSVYAVAIYSGAMYVPSTPGNDRNLGLELNAGVLYETEDGFFANVGYGVLFPFAGLGYSSAVNSFGQLPALDIAQAIRGNIGIKF